jgi:hypothetical protein
LIRHRSARQGRQPAWRPERFAAGQDEHCVERPILVVPPLRNPNRTKGSSKRSAEVFGATPAGPTRDLDIQNMIGSGKMIVAGRLRK